MNLEGVNCHFTNKRMTTTLPGVYDDNTAEGGDNIILEKEYSLDKDIPDGID